MQYNFIHLFYAYMWLLCYKCLLRNDLTIGGGWRIEYHRVPEDLFTVLIGLLIIFLDIRCGEHLHCNILFRVWEMNGRRREKFVLRD